MTQAVRILRNWFDGGELVFKAGECYAADDAALRQVALCNGEVIEVPAQAEETLPADEPDTKAAQEPAAETAQAGRKKKA